MKNFKIVALLFVVLLSSCERVQPNYVGVLMENYGKSGKEDFSLTLGRVWTISPGTELFQVPLYKKRAGFEQTLHLKSSNNTEFTTKPTYTYRIIKDKAIDVLFDNKQIIDSSSVDFSASVENNVIEPLIYETIKDQSRQYHSDTLMSNGAQIKFENKLQTILKSQLAELGFELLTFSSQLGFTDAVTKKIDSRNEVNTNISVLDQKIAEQKKRNELAELETQERLIESRGITPQILDKMAIERWNGELNGTYLNNNIPFIKSIK